MQGLSVDIINALQQQDPTLSITGHERFIPLPRINKMLEVGTLDLFVGLAKTDARQKKYRFIETPLYPLNYIAVVRADEKVDEYSIGDIESLSQQGRVISLFGAAVSARLQRLDVEVDDGAKSVEAMLQKLVSGRGDIVFYHDLGLLNSIRDMGLESSVRVLPVSYRRYHHYLAVSNGLDPASVDKLGKALLELHKSGRLQRISDPYLTLPVPSP